MIFKRTVRDFITPTLREIVHEFKERLYVILQENCTWIYKKTVRDFTRKQICDQLPENCTYVNLEHQR